MLSLATGEHHTVVEQGYHARYVPTGHIVYTVGGSLMAVGFDLQRMETTGQPVLVEEGIRGMFGRAGEADFAVSRTGFLVFSPGPLTEGSQARRTLTWVSRGGKEEPLAAPPRRYAYPRLSPDGTQVALDVRDSDGRRHLGLAPCARDTDTGDAQVRPWDPSGP